ncbi:hypothetical protein C2S53_012673 [Perilla frutescens var. hirtella]|uniref:Uncharacterized protein n=1 Tax=Perilla frutescens var. hirtella TaxID=608512 RepID=A0AAD4JHE1_PERFH|nr:hypothetical protein C2S53_012673 [Perilla frutescens var. hirtella]
MGNVGEEGRDLPLRIVRGADSPNAGPRGQRLHKSGARVETLSRAVWTALIRNDPIEETITHNICNFHSVASPARPRPAVRAAVVVVVAAVPVFAAALVRLAAALLGGNPFSGGQKKSDKGEDGEEIFHFLRGCGKTGRGGMGIYRLNYMLIYIFTEMRATDLLVLNFS